MRKIEEIVDRGTKQFFKILKFNILTATGFAFGIVLVLYKVISLRYMILILGFYNLISIINQIIKLRVSKKKKRSSKKRKFWGNLIVDVIFLDCLGRGFCCLLYFLVDVIPGLNYSMCFGPIFVCLVWIISMTIHKMCKRKTFSMKKTFTLMLRIFFAFQICNIFLKLDGFLIGSWSKSFWPFWIIFSMMVGLSFTIILIFLAKLCSALFFKIDAYDSKF